MFAIRFKACCHEISDQGFSTQMLHQEMEIQTYITYLLTHIRDYRDTLPLDNLQR